MSIDEEWPFQVPMKTAKIVLFYGLKMHLGMSDIELINVTNNRKDTIYVGER